MNVAQQHEMQEVKNRSVLDVHLTEFGLTYVDKFAGIFKFSISSSFYKLFRKL